MGHHYDGLAFAVDRLEEVENALAGFGVEVAGRFVGENDCRVVGQHPGEGDALLLADAQFRWFVVQPVGQADPLQEFGGAFALIGFVRASQLIKFWRIAVVIIFVIAAVATPTTDPVTMLFMALPLTLLYVISIGLVRMVEKRPTSSGSAGETPAPPPSDEESFSGPEEGEQ